MAKLSDYKRNGIFYGESTDPFTGKRTKKSLATTDRETAKRRLKEWERTLVNPSGTAPDKTTSLDECLELLVLDVSKGRSKATIQFYTTKSGHLKRLLPVPYVQLLTRSHINAYIATRQNEGAADNTISKELCTLSVLLRTIKDNGLYSGSINEVIPQFSVNYIPKKDHLTPTQADRMLMELEPSKSAHAAFLLASGCRWGESERAKPEHCIRPNVVGDPWFLEVDGTKTDKANGTIGIILPKLCTLLDYSVSLAPRYTPEGSRETFLFRPWANVRRDLHDACKRAGIAPVSPNTFRHTTAQWLLDAGVQHDRVSHVLRHVDGRMVYKTYGAPDARQLAERMAIDIRVASH